MEDARPAMREITVDGLRLAYIDQGEGEVIVFVHGYPQDHRTWRHSIEAFSKTHRVIAIDWFGWGQSQRSFLKEYDYETEVARLGCVLDALGIDRCNLFVHDYGGLIGLGFVAAYPARILRFALLNSRSHETFPGLFYFLMALVGFMARSSLLRPLLHVLPLAWMHRAYLRPYVKSGCFDERLLQGYTRWMEDPDEKRWWAHFFRFYPLAPKRGILPYLRGLPFPCSIIWGTGDPYCPVEVGRELASAFAHGEYVEIQDGGHYLMERKPQEVNAALAALLVRPCPSKEVSQAAVPSPEGKPPLISDGVLSFPAPIPRESPIYRKNRRDGILFFLAFLFFCAGIAVILGRFLIAFSKP